MKRVDKILVALIAGLVIALVWVVNGTLEPTVIGVGDTAPSFTVVTDRGKTMTSSQFGGKLLVLNFWATWCAGCLQEIQSLDAFQRTFAARGVVVLGISMDTDEIRYEQFLRQFPIAFATARDPDWNIGSKYGTFELPETYIIDHSGKVVEKIIAGKDFMDPDFVTRIQKIL